ncbi:MAG: EAL domain-containing protein [Lachnospiraceae bacterium]|nr:EAL domain-containing protein [Lachnospiraceae bacterium]
MEMIFNEKEQVRRFILIVDDEYINREILGNMLEDEYHVLYAVNGREALEVVKENASMLSAILLDIMMPEMTGFEVIEELHKDEEYKHIPIIVLTSEQNAEVKSLKLGAADFIKKPYGEPEIIRARVERIIELSEDKKFIQAAEKDELTGLYNKSFFYEYAEMMDRYHTDLKTDAVTLNIDHFHLVNEIYGREFGDKLLVIIADTIRDFMKDCEGLACRSDADNFFLYISHHEDYNVLVDKINTNIIDITGTPNVRIRVGIFSRVEHDLDMEQRFSCARLACNTLRDSFMHSIAYYDLTLREKSIFSQRLISDINEALEKNQFEVYYQPKYDITGDEPVLSSAEALVRWNHPEFGMIKPKVFLPLFEQNGLVNALDHYVWKDTIKHIRGWKDAYGKSVPISVNVSRMDLYDNNIADYLLDLLEDNGLSADDLYLEITESAYTNDTTQLVKAVQGLRNEGFKIEMDDFGAGYSSLNVLSSMPVDVLKLDMDFIAHIHEDDKAFHMVKLILDMAEYMEVPVIAEGVEMAAQFDLLKEAGCQIIQGYYFSKPISEKDFIELLNEE